MKKIISLICGFALLISLSSCGESESPPPEDRSTKLSFMAQFYDNHGNEWLSVKGTSFDILPNKIKEYSYSSSGEWISEWITSSVVTIRIDDKDIQSCGNTVIFSDTRLKPVDMTLPDEVTLSQNPQLDINLPKEYSWGEYFTIGYWWHTHRENMHPGSKIVVIQSQEGDPIATYLGDNVTWQVARQLPKTTLLTIDDKELYIHRANFAIVDTSIFD